MTRRQWLVRSARFHLRRHLGTLLGGSVATMTLTAAVLVGASVRSSLQRAARLRLGAAEFAVQLAAPAPLPAELPDTEGGPAGAQLSRALLLDGTATAPDRKLRADHVRVVGVDERFFELFTGRHGAEAPSDDEAWPSRALANRLELGEGDELILRVPVVSALPPDVPLGGAPTVWSARRMKVGRILPDDAGGRFDLRPSSLPPLNLFVRRDTLAELAGRPGTANVLLLKRTQRMRTVDDVRRAVERAAGPAGRNLACRALPGGGVEVRSASVFLDALTLAALTNALPGGRPLLTYLVNAWRTGDRSVPYSFAAGIASEPVPADLAADEIVLHADLAHDLGVLAGGSIRAEYFILDGRQQLIETHTVFRVRAVVTHPRDPSLVPELPGVSTAASCRDWKTPFPLDFSRIRPADEDDWARWRGAPKAWLRYETAAALWSNRFGVATALRWPAPASLTDIERAAARVPLAAEFTDLRAAAHRAASGGPDFTLLFLGLGGFLLASAVLLQVWMFAAALHGRVAEIRLLAALGFGRREISRLLLGETAVVALLAAALGTIVGIGLAWALLVGLQTIWRDATGDASLSLALPLLALANGTAAGWSIAMLAAARVVLHHTAMRPLQASLCEQHSRRRVSPSWRTTPRRWAPPAIGTALAFALAVVGQLSADERPLARLAAGAAVLATITLALRSWLASESPARHRSNPAAFGPRSWRRHPLRALTAILVPACGWFVVFAVETHRPRTPNTESRTSPAGGFCAIAELSLPLPEDPRSPEGRRRWRLDKWLDTAGVRILPLRRVEGAPADCRNIQRVDRPPLLGVPAELFDALGAFRWRRRPAGVPAHRPWSALLAASPPDEIPAVLDASVATWGLRLRIGDRLALTDERGRTLSLRVVGLLDDTIFQGSILIDERRLVERFPSAPHRMLLIEAPSDQRARLRAELSERFEDLGFTWTSTRDRLDTLLDVQRAYLDIFLAFSVLGLAFGSLGFGALAWRTLIERRGELAMLLALGWTPQQLRRLAATEHWFQAWAALGAGFLAALVAFPPRTAAWLGWLRVGGLAALSLAVTAAIAVCVGVSLALRGPLILHLRKE
ncbi:MAG: FtsX-like permease family protein [Kiritimatiellae bacterium]|nr:FtsX-like permease family protein [Kiritimatiellia bacterium]